MLFDQQMLNILQVAMEHLNLSARAYSRILKVARTIADLDTIVVSHENCQVLQITQLSQVETPKGRRGCSLLHQITKFNTCELYRTKETCGSQG